MCQRVTCRKCGKPSWAGCGAHVEQVLGNVPRAERCQCREKQATARVSDIRPDQRSWLSRLFGN